VRYERMQTYSLWPDNANEDVHRKQKTVRLAKKEI